MQLDNLQVNSIYDGFKIFRLGDFDIHSKGIRRTPMLTELEKNTVIHDHCHNVETDFYFIYGSGEIYLDGIKKIYKPGDHFFVDKEVMHGFLAYETTLFLSSIDLPLESSKPDLTKDLVN